LTLVFDPFRDNTHAKRRRKINDRLDDGATLWVRPHPFNKCTVDFQGVEMESSKITQGGISGSEVIQLQTHLQGLDAGQNVLGGFDFRQHRAFRQFQF